MLEKEMEAGLLRDIKEVGCLVLKFVSPGTAGAQEIHGEKLKTL